VTAYFCHCRHGDEFFVDLVRTTLPELLDMGRRGVFWLAFDASLPERPLVACSYVSITDGHSALPALYESAVASAASASASAASGAAAAVAEGGVGDGVTGDGGDAGHTHGVPLRSHTDVGVWELSPSRVGHIGMVTVHPSQQHRSLGLQLMLLAEAEAVYFGCQFTEVRRCGRERDGAMCRC
jgi:hypothetical protein